MVRLFDTHTHINTEVFFGKEAETIERAKTFHAHYLNVVGFDYPTIKRAIELAEQYEQVWAIIGWHPTESYAYDATVEKYLIEQLAHPKVVAMGEMGLDYYWDTSTPADQERAFRRQLAIAREMKLPVIIHNRDAIADCYRILKEEKVYETGGVMHSFNGDPEYTERFLDLDMHLSYSGVLTFKNAPEVRASAQIVPANRYLIETDCPYLAPVPYRGKQNEPAYVQYVATEMAKVRQISYEQVGRETTQNAMKLFGLEKEGWAVE
ncbi:TatD family hydrolase [Atopobacter phocae]|uniref:TatD family hydrolase n=1 Tax=Atopobacter phocae TaxID=136492 RepID=UPI0004710106|nr:TatD family hydrolase [Atopobacter phocae]